MNGGQRHDAERDKQTSMLFSASCQNIGEIALVKKRDRIFSSLSHCDVTLTQLGQDEEQSKHRGLNDSGTVQIPRNNGLGPVYDVCSRTRYRWV